ncbi:unnamed protein product, partial [Toxocara canis]|uniref:Tudor-knot domain-containing protein n=1 Tax=Toxocara canis TaxID=6265 RepID=A0A183VEI0_TOXCA
MGSSYVGRKKEETMGSSSQVERKKTYELNERVLCQHTDNLYYDAKIVGMSVARSGTRLYTIHYKGWSKRYDETFEESKAAFRLRPFTESGFIKARAELKAARAKIQLARKAKLSGTRKGFIKKERESEKRQNLVTSSAPGNTARARSESARTARAITTKAKTLKKNACLSVPAALSDKSREGKLKKVEVKMDEDELMAGSVGPAERRSNRSHIAS